MPQNSSSIPTQSIPLSPLSPSFCISVCVSLTVVADLLLLRSWYSLWRSLFLYCGGRLAVGCLLLCPEHVDSSWYRVVVGSEVAVMPAYRSFLPACCEPPPSDHPLFTRLPWRLVWKMFSSATLCLEKKEGIWKNKLWCWFWMLSYVDRLIKHEVPVMFFVPYLTYSEWTMNSLICTLIYF